MSVFFSGALRARGCVWPGSGMQWRVWAGDAWGQVVTPLPPWGKAGMSLQLNSGFVTDGVPRLGGGLGCCRQRMSDGCGVQCSGLFRFSVDRWLSGHDGSVDCCQEVLELSSGPGTGGWQTGAHGCASCGSAHAPCLL